MRRLAKYFLLIVISSFVAFMSSEAQGKSGKTKVKIIHNGHVISVAPEAVPAHLAHGDELVNPPTEYTVTVNIEFYAFLDDGFGGLVLTLISTETYSQSVAAGGSYTFEGILPETVTLISSSGATIEVVGFDVVVTNVQSNATAEFHSILVDVGGDVGTGS